MKTKHPKLSFRNCVQLIFVFISLYVGVRFINFYRYLETAGAAGSPYRPPGVEAFTPLSALVGLKVWLGTGTFDYIHPAGLMILVSALLISFLFRKSFCSWICPFGFLEELLGKLGHQIMPKKLKMPGWLDIGLRSLKYILLTFFIYSVFFMMSSLNALDFMKSPYNLMVDLKMLQFFLNISATGITIFAFLAIMSVLFDHFWCRYLCPYGALLGILGWFSPSRISRQEDLCVNCQACNKACPSRLNVSMSKNINSPECNACLSCVESCPVPGALSYNIMGFKGNRKYILPLAMVSVFALILIAAIVSGYWESSVSLREVMMYYPYLNQMTH